MNKYCSRAVASVRRVCYKRVEKREGSSAFVSRTGTNVKRTPTAGTVTEWVEVLLFCHLIVFVRFTNPASAFLTNAGSAHKKSSNTLCSLPKRTNFPFVFLCTVKRSVLVLIFFFYFLRISDADLTRHTCQKKCCRFLSCCFKETELQLEKSKTD